jgi:hypothetical protein
MLRHIGTRDALLLAKVKLQRRTILMVALAKDSIDLQNAEAEKVCQRMKKIRQLWTPEQREYRAELARQKQANLFNAFLKAAGIQCSLG